MTAGLSASGTVVQQAVLGVCGCPAGLDAAHASAFRAIAVMRAWRPVRVVLHLVLQSMFLSSYSHTAGAQATGAAATGGARQDGTEPSVKQDVSFQN